MDINQLKAHPANRVDNTTPMWKYLLLVAVICLGFIYALPNLYGEDPALQITPAKTLEMTPEVVAKAEQTLKDAGISIKSFVSSADELKIRFLTTEDQLKAKDILDKSLGRNYLSALNLASATPDWLAAFNAQPMYLGLDLRGGVHFLMDVDMEAALAQRYERTQSEMRSLLRQEKVRYRGVELSGETLVVKLRDAQDLDAAKSVLQREYPDFMMLEQPLNTEIHLTLLPDALAEFKKNAVKQNITTLRNRVNELGVAEPVIQQQGERRIVVELPGVQDTARAKEILGATATLEFRLADDKADADQAQRSGIIPGGDRLYTFRDGRPILLKRDVIVTGKNVTDAQSGIDSRDGQANVSVTLDGPGGSKMLEITKKHVGTRMAVVFIERKVTTKWVNGKEIKDRKVTQDVINAAVIRDQFSSRFQITGLDSPREARDLALLLRAGALAAPMEIVEERTVGPSLGQANIDQGFMSVIVGMLLVLVFMVVRYRVFGLIANTALILNLVLLVAVLSMLQATLTLPGIAGIVLTVGMAVDANVLIFERIKEELRLGRSVQQAIDAGYGKAFVTIADANITTLLAAVVLFIFGTGPIKGFAITLSIGILTSMFTAILGTRAVVNWQYGNKKLEKLPL